VKHISLDQEAESVKSFVRSLPVDPEGSILEIEGEAVLRVLPAGEPAVDQERLRAAILHRRDASRETNAEWEDADRGVWDAGQSTDE
jgi:hypothetical protein